MAWSPSVVWSSLLWSALCLHPGSGLRARTIHMTASSPSSLLKLREQVAFLELDLNRAISSEDFEGAVTLRNRLAALRSQDPQQRMHDLTAALDEAVTAEDYASALDLHTELMKVRRALPQYQLAGLWRGLYPHHGEETIRIRYSGKHSEELIATKVTGDENVPRGEVTFRATLTEPPSSFPLRKVGPAVRTGQGGGRSSPHSVRAGVSTHVLIRRHG